MLPEITILRSEPMHPFRMARVDFFDLIAHESGLPAEWRWFQVERVDGFPSGIMMRGAVVNAVYRRGNREGEWNWDKRDKRTERKLFISRDALASRKDKWESDTGLCSECFGCGYRMVGGGIESTRYRKCGRCVDGKVSELALKAGDA